ncbi:ArsR family transcriptional regulator [Streptomyces sp. NPDC005551]|uniref:ArsR family transcriptional regulator n=1 Tax=Streptomyces sp. NPDC005551 TaxID=3364725 RepID=UPI003696F25C
MLKVPAGEDRLEILEWMRNPAGSATPRDRDADGVSSTSVAAALGMSLPVASAHLDLLARLGLLRAERTGGRTVYRRDEYRIAEVKHLFEKGW